MLLHYRLFSTEGKRSCSQCRYDECFTSIIYICLSPWTITSRSKHNYRSKSTCSGSSFKSILNDVLNVLIFLFFCNWWLFFFCL
uniref:Putative ovule protein n=1 Tax=Solanum chacoense TaxID=4108 RepID=A0A0V0H5C6_SOLCH